MTSGGDKLDYPVNTRSPVISITYAKIHINSTISNAKNGAQYPGLDIKNSDFVLLWHTTNGLFHNSVNTG